MKYIHKASLLILCSVLGSNILAISNYSGTKNQNKLAFTLVEQKSKSEITPEKPTPSHDFVENKGQILSFEGLSQPNVKFVFQRGNTQLFLLERGIAYQFTKTSYPEGYLNLIKDKFASQNLEKLKVMREEVRTEIFRMDMTLVGADPLASITTEGKSSDYTNFYNKNVLDVHSYDKVIYHEIYPGIDWVIYSKEGNVKYDFIVRPGADPSIIKMEFKHQEELSLNEDGSFTSKNLLGSITETRPISFQDNKEVSTKFNKRENQISFSIGNYDRAQVLRIDPALDWATYYGGSSIENGLWCATDAYGDVFLGGSTGSNSNISSGGYQLIYGGGTSEAFLTKFSRLGVRLWSTYYGSTGDDFGESCAVDASGNVFLAGQTTSTLNIASGGHQNVFGGGIGGDAFLVKFNSSGLRQWSTYYGGTNSEFAYSCATDGAGNVYLGGATSSTSNISSGGFQNSFNGVNDAFLVKFDQYGIRQWGTYYGGLGDEAGYCCTTDNSGNIYLSGFSNSSTGISSGGHQTAFGGGTKDAFLVKFNASGQRQWATYYGGAGDDYALCATDFSGNVYLIGTTSSFSNIASGGYQNSVGGSDDAFLAKFNSSGLRQWATYYGGSGTEYGYSCAINNSGDIYITGGTNSTTNIASGGFQNNLGGSDDTFIAKFNSTGSRLYGTYYGGTGLDYANWCSVDLWGTLYLAGATNSSSNIASAGYQNAPGGGGDAFISRLCDAPPPSPLFITGNYTVCELSVQGYSINASPQAISYIWILPLGWVGSSLTNSIIVNPISSGTLTVWASNGCGMGPYQSAYITVNPNPTLQITGNNSICEGLSITQVVNGSASSYVWSDGSTGNVANLTPTATTVYTVTGINMYGCTSQLTKTITVNPLPSLTITSPADTICSGETLTLNVTGAISYTWNNGQNLAQISVTPITTTNYSVIGVDVNSCSNLATMTQVVNPCTSVEQFPKNGNGEIDIYPNPSNGLLSITSKDFGNINLIVYNAIGEKVFRSTFEKNSSIDISQLANGFYLFVFKLSNGLLKKVKVIKE